MVHLGADRFPLTFHGIPGVNYCLVSSADLATPMNTWSAVPGSTNTAPSPTGQWSFTVNAAALQFYRLRAINPVP
jgi:hypothetical protein